MKIACAWLRRCVSLCHERASQSRNTGTVLDVFSGFGSKLTAKRDELFKFSRPCEIKYSVLRESGYLRVGLKIDPCGRTRTVWPPTDHWSIQTLHISPPFFPFNATSHFHVDICSVDFFFFCFWLNTIKTHQNPSKSVEIHQIRRNPSKSTKTRRNPSKSVETRRNPSNTVLGYILEAFFSKTSHRLRAITLAAHDKHFSLCPLIDMLSLWRTHFITAWDKFSFFSLFFSREWKWRTFVSEYLLLLVFSRQLNSQVCCEAEFALGLREIIVPSIHRACGATARCHVAFSSTHYFIWWDLSLIPWPILVYFLSFFSRATVFDCTPDDGVWMEYQITARLRYRDCAIYRVTASASDCFSQWPGTANVLLRFILLFNQAPHFVFLPPKSKKLVIVQGLGVFFIIILLTHTHMREYHPQYYCHFGVFNPSLRSHHSSVFSSACLNVTCIIAWRTVACGDFFLYPQ